jgi:hypothetical protein
LAVFGRFWPFLAVSGSFSTEKVSFLDLKMETETAPAGWHCPDCSEGTVTEDNSASSSSSSSSSSASGGVDGNSSSGGNSHAVRAAVSAAVSTNTYSSIGLVGAPYCRICGCRLQRTETRQAIEASPRANVELFGLAQQNGEAGIVLSDAILRDDLLSGLFESFAGLLQGRSSVPLSKTYLKTLGKVVLDEKLTLLHDVSLNFGPQLRFNVVPAAFSWLPHGKSFSGNVCWADPVYGETELSDKNKWAGHIIVFMRGKVSFAKKYHHAVLAGATAVIICQTFDMWPFVMADSAGELSVLFPDGTPPIPVVMLSKQNTDDMQDMLTRAATISTSSPLAGAPVCATLQFSQMEVDCSICADAFCAGQEVVKLPCRHLFHCDCVFTWLDKHTTCPICRSSMPAETRPVLDGPSNPERGANVNNQQYFV